MNYDIVFHFDRDEAELKITISNISNYYKALPDAEISAVLVVNGPGIQWMGKDHPYAEPLRELSVLGLSIRVCQNALDHFNLTPAWLNPVCRIVPAGILEIVALQKQGYAYIKP